MIFKLQDWRLGDGKREEREKKEKRDGEEGGAQQQAAGVAA